MEKEEISLKSIILNRSIDLEKYEVLMEIGRKERREELHAILMLADELGGRVSATDICNELLLGRPTSVGRAIIDRCRYLELLDHSDRLTETGKEAIRNGELFIPERGRYVLWYTNDPLISQKLLHVEAVRESSLYKEVRINGNGNEHAENLSEKILNLEGRTFTLLSPGGGHIIIRKIEAKGVICKLKKTDILSATLHIAPSRIAQLDVKGRFQHKLQVPGIDFETAWLSVLGSLARSWENSRNPPALKIAFKELNDKELASFKKTIHLTKPNLQSYGTFENTSVKNVPIIPKSRGDAAQWAKWLLKRSIHTYMDRKQYQDQIESCKSQFLDFEDIELPSLEELVLEFREEKFPDGRLPREYWYLQAPLDLQEGVQ